MKKFLLSGVALAVLVATPALAADMATRGPVYKAMPAAAPLFNWTGFYVGAHAGYGWGDASGFSTNGWYGGGQLGVNYQFAPNWVWGVEADISGADISGGNAAVQRFKTDIFGTARLRLGYTVDRTMFYGTGGLAWADSNASLAGVSDSSANVGWALGAGIEYAFAPNWTAKIEYMHMAFGHDDYNIPATTRIDNKIDTVKVGVNYLFNTGGGRW